ncbi:hypothetical protein D3C72_1426930 [compost metagenome]
MAEVFTVDAEAAPVPKVVSHWDPLTFGTLFIVCQASRIFPSGSRLVSLNTSIKAALSVYALVPTVAALPILPESSSDRITLGAT